MPIKRTEEADLHQAVRHGFYDGHRFTTLTDRAILTLLDDNDEHEELSDEAESAELMASLLMHDKLPLSHLERTSPTTLAAVARQRLLWTGHDQCVCIHGAAGKHHMATAVVVHLVAAERLPEDAMAKVAAARRLLSAFTSTRSSIRCGYTTSFHYDHAPSSGATDAFMASALPVSYPYYDCHERPVPAVGLRAVEVSLLAFEGGAGAGGTWHILQALTEACYGPPLFLQSLSPSGPPHAAPPSSSTSPGAPAWVAQTLHKAAVALSTASPAPTPTPTPTPAPAPATTLLPWDTSFVAVLEAMDTLGLPRGTAEGFVRALTAVLLLTHLARAPGRGEGGGRSGEREALVWAAAAGCLGVEPDVLQYCLSGRPVVELGAADAAARSTFAAVAAPLGPRGLRTGVVVACTSNNSSSRTSSSSTSSSDEGATVARVAAARAASIEAFAALLYARLVRALVRDINAALVFAPNAAPARGADAPGPGPGPAPAAISIHVIEAPTFIPCTAAAPGGWAELAVNYTADRLRAALLTSGGATCDGVDDEEDGGAAGRREAAECLQLCTLLPLGLSFTHASPPGPLPLRQLCVRSSVPPASDAVPLSPHLVAAVLFFPSQLRTPRQASSRPSPASPALPRAPQPRRESAPSATTPGPRSTICPTSMPT